MTADEREPAIERLDADWERLLRGAARSPVPSRSGPDAEPDLMMTVRYLYALDAASCPPPLLAEQIWRDLLGPAQASGRVIPLHGALPLLPIDAQAPAGDPRPADAKRPGFPLWSLIELAAVAAIILAVVGGVMLNRRAIQRLTVPLFDETGGDVPMFHGNAARTGVMPGPGPVGDPIVRWQFRTSDTDALSSPAVVDGVVFVGSAKGYVHAIDAASGTERWTFSADAPVYSSPAVDEGVVYVGSGGRTSYVLGSRIGSAGALHALDAATGVERWRYAAANGIDGDPAVVDGVVYVGNRDGELISLDAETGTERWHYRVDDAANSPAVADGVVYLTTPNGVVEAIDAMTGERRWHTAYDVSLMSPPAVANGVIYIAIDPTTSDSVAFVALDGASGQEHWRIEHGVGTWGISVLRAATPVITDGVVFVATGGGVIYAAEASTGTVLWQSIVPPCTGGSPVVADGVLYAGGYPLLALDVGSGAELWRLEIRSVLPNGISSSPAAVDGTIYIAAYNGYLYAVDGTGDSTGSPTE